MKKIFKLAVIVLFLALSKDVFAQPTITTNKITVKDSIKIKNQFINGVTTDTALGSTLTTSKKKLPTEYAVKNYVLNRQGWGLTGNAGTTSANFIGTTDAQPLRFSVNDSQVGYFGVDGSIAFGGANLVSNTGIFNIAVGGFSLSANTTGDNNNGLGVYSLLGNTTGSNNTAIGINALQMNTSGSNNIAIGAHAGLEPFNSNNKLYINSTSTALGGPTLIYGDFSTGQVLINAASTPVLRPSAAFEIISTTKAFLPARMTKTQRNAITTPVAGLLIYQTDNTPGLRTYNGTNWIKYTETTD